MKFCFAELVRSFTVLKGTVNLKWRFGSRWVRNEIYRVSQTYLNTGYCLGGSCIITHIRKWWYVPQKFAAVQSSGEQRGKDFRI